MTRSALRPLDIVRTRSLTSLVQQEIERMILSGELRSGERVNEQVLAAKLGVSRGPVREATRGLERAGLVTAVVNHGVYVRKVSPEEAFELYEVRALLTGFACERLARNSTIAQRSHLERLVERMDSAALAGNSTVYYALNLEFHDALMSYADNARAKQVDESLIKEMHLFRQRSLVAPENMRQSNAEHHAMVAAIVAGDAAAARRAGESHVSGGRRRFAATAAVDDHDSTGSNSITGSRSVGGRGRRSIKGGNHDAPKHDSEHRRRP